MASLREIYFRFRTWLNQSVKNRFLFWNIGFWILAVIILSLTIVTTSQSEIMSDIRGRNIQIASIISRELNTKISGILSDVRIFARHLESLGEDINSQASALINLRISSPQRYMAAYLFNSNNNMLIHVDDPVEDLLSLDEIYDIITRPVIPVNNTLLSKIKTKPYFRQV